MNLIESGPYPNPFIYGILRAIAIAISKTVWRLKHSGTQNIPLHLASGYVIAANHQTYIDPVWIAIPIKSKKIRYLAWDEAFKWRFVGGLMRYLGAVPVNTRSGRSTESWRVARRTLDEGMAVMIFPEGGREFPDGKFLPFKPGAIRLALEANVPILPVTVRGANRVWPQGFKYPKPGRVEIVYHPLMYLGEAPTGKELHEFVRQSEESLKEIIASAAD